MAKKKNYAFNSKVILWQGAAAWHFICLPKDVSREIKEAHGKFARGWGSLPIRATINKVAEGRPHVVDIIKNREIALVINTVEEKRNAINDSRAIRVSSLAAGATTYTTIAGAEAAVEGMRYLREIHVYDLQGLHKTLH